MPVALVIAEMLIKYGAPVVVSMLERWHKEEPHNNEPREWLELLKAHSLTRTYEEEIKAAEERK